DITGIVLRTTAAGIETKGLEDMRRDWPPVEHPIIRTHPATGRPLLFINENFTTRIVGMAEKESDSLLRMLFEHVQAPELQCRFRWTPDAVAFWDNRAALHYAVADYDERRVMRRVTLAG